MNCDTYLSMLATLPVEDLGYDDAREHVANCRDCDRVTRVVVERERSMLMAFGELYPSVPAGSIATRAIVLSRRRRIAFYYRVGLGVAAAASTQLLCALAGVGWVAGADGVRHELRTGQAAVIARGELHAKGSDTGLTALMVQIADLATTPHAG